MGYGALMPELNENQPACAMNGGCNRRPLGALFFAVNSRRSIPPLSLLAYKSSLCDDQPCACPLRVILNHQLIRHFPLVVGSGAR
jgi:hypothetical protein